MANGISFTPTTGRAAPPPHNHRRPLPPLDDEYHTILTVEIHHAENIDLTTKDLNDYPRIYTVVGFVDAPENEFRTLNKRGYCNPQWFEKFELKLENYEPCSNKFLHLEVIRVRCLKDPGTSTGIEVVGRTKISLPEIGEKAVRRKYELTVMENGLVSSKPRGRIGVGLEMNLSMKQRKRYSCPMY